MELQPYETFERPEPRSEVVSAIGLAMLDRGLPKADELLAEIDDWTTLEERRIAREAVIAHLSATITRGTAAVDQADAWLRDHDGGGGAC